MWDESFKLGELPVPLRLSQLCQAGQLKEVVQKNLLPSDEMIISLRKTFHTEQREDKVHVDAEAVAPEPAVRRKNRPPMDTRNRAYAAKTAAPCKNFIQVLSPVIV